MPGTYPSPVRANIRKQVILTPRRCLAPTRLAPTRPWHLPVPGTYPSYRANMRKQVIPTPRRCRVPISAYAQTAITLLAFSKALKLFGSKGVRANGVFL